MKGRKVNIYEKSVIHFEMFLSHRKKRFSKPVTSQLVRVESFIAFLRAWDLTSKYKDLDRDLLSNSYIVL